MGYRGKLAERARARELRARAWTLREIADELGVSRSSVSVWVRDVEFTPRPRDRAAARQRPPNALQRRNEVEIASLREAGRERIGELSNRELLVAGTMLYAGEGGKTDGVVKVANSDPALIAFFCAWLRHFFEIDEARLRLYLYLHEEPDLRRAMHFWSDLTTIPLTQFGRPYRAAADPTIRRAKHMHGCATVRYCCSRTHRAIMGLVAAVVDPAAWGPMRGSGW